MAKVLRAIITSNQFFKYFKLLLLLKLVGQHLRFGEAQNSVSLQAKCSLILSGNTQEEFPCLAADYGSTLPQTLAFQILAPLEIVLDPSEQSLSHGCDQFSKFNHLIPGSADSKPLPVYLISRGGCSFAQKARANSQIASGFIMADYPQVSEGEGGVAVARVADGAPPAVGLPVVTVAAAAAEALVETVLRSLDDGHFTTTPVPRVKITFNAFESNDPLTVFLQGKSYGESPEEMENAVFAFSKLLGIKPSFSPAAYELANIFQKMNETAKSFEVFSQFLPDMARSSYWPSIYQQMTNKNSHIASTFSSKETHTDLCFGNDSSEEEVLTAVTVATDTNRLALQTLKADLQKIGIILTVLGKGKDYGTRGGTKIVLMQEYLASCEPETTVLFMDAYDVLLAPSFAAKGELLQRFKAMQASIIFGAEKESWPDLAVSLLYPADKRGQLSSNVAYPYLNSGAYIGKAWALQEMMDWVLLKMKHELEPVGFAFKHADDQRWLTRYYLTFPHKAALDTEGFIFQNMHAISLTGVDQYMRRFHQSNQTCNEEYVVSTGEEPDYFSRTHHGVNRNYKMEHCLEMKMKGEEGGKYDETSSTNIFSEFSSSRVYPLFFHGNGGGIVHFYRLLCCIKGLLCEESEEKIHCPE